MSFFERPGWGESAVLVHCNFSVGPQANCLQELTQLAESAGADVHDTFVCSRQSPSPRFLIGSGALGSLTELVQTCQAELVIFNHDLSPAQGRNLEKQLCVRVVDRTGLILDIFAQRARTHEGKLQVELAQLKHLLTRLVRGWTHLERQKGGIGLRGPGETQLESDRRLVRERISRIEQRLKQVRKQRGQSLRSRVRSATPLVALVGYTNVGKSTLFNSLTASKVYAADQLFATLDTTHRQIEAPGFGSVVLSDTVGFMRNLPHHLVRAFRGTLEEVAQADLIVEVVDASERHEAVFHDKVQAVDEVIQQVGAGHVPRLRVFNKIDLSGDSARKDTNSAGIVEAIWVSANTGLGLELVVDAFLSAMRLEWVEAQLHIGANQGQLRAALYRQGAVLTESSLASGDSQLQVRLPAGQYAYIMKHFADN